MLYVLHGQEMSLLVGYSGILSGCGNGLEGRGAREWKMTIQYLRTRFALTKTGVYVLMRYTQVNGV